MSHIKTTFGFKSTSMEVVAGIQLHGKKAIVTGAASGLGVETARALAMAGAEVTLAVRNTDAGRSVMHDIRNSTGNELVHVARLDLTDRRSIEAFTDDWNGPLHILVNNAGVMALPDLQKTHEGLEMQFGTNHMGHFALAVGLHSAMSKAGNARIVSVSSSAHLLSPFIFDDVNFDFRRYEPWLAYAQSKTANALFAVGATLHWAKHGITVNALNPGAIATNLQRHVGNKLQTPPGLQKTVQQGAATSVLLATSPLLEGIGGKYFEDCNEATVVNQRPDSYQGVAPYALDEENANKLWELSLRLLT